MNLSIEKMEQLYLHPLIKDKMEVLLEVSASVAPSDTIIRLRLMIPAAPKPCKARPASNILQD